MGAGTQGFGPSAAAFPGHQQDAGSEVEQLGRVPEVIRDVSVTGRGLTHHTTKAALALFTD